MSDADRTRLRRERVGFVFQSFNLLGMLTAKQNILLPFELAGTDPDWAWFDSIVRVLGHRAIGSGIGRRRCPAASSSGSPRLVPW